VTVLPFVVGLASAEDVAEALEVVWGGDETLVVVSTDLSHYLDYETATRVDRVTAAAVVAGRPAEIGPEAACGAYPLRGLLVAAGRHGLAIDVLDLRNSGDTAGPRDRVVGYGGFALAGV
jgi:AmmeMemoRadiSam system protein B